MLIFFFFLRHLTLIYKDSEKESDQPSDNEGLGSGQVAGIVVGIVGAALVVSDDGTTRRFFNIKNDSM